MTNIHHSINLLLTASVLLWGKSQHKRFNPTDSFVTMSAGPVIQGPPLAWGLFPLLPMQALTGGQTILHQGWAVAVYWVLLQRVLLQVPWLQKDHHAWWEISIWELHGLLWLYYDLTNYFFFQKIQTLQKNTLTIPSQLQSDKWLFSRLGKQPSSLGV